ncbi:MAG TPA: hypothetical protein PK095_05530 [Myxococcota bacterium]|nr:hypothetical protein [Myxococcota bacterium]
MRRLLILATALAALAASACEPVEDTPTDVIDTTSADTSDVADLPPAGPVTVVPGRKTVGFELRNNSQGTPEYHAELCMTGAMARDPRDGLTLSRGKTCIDSLVLRFFIARTGNTAEAGWGAAFTNMTSSHGALDAAKKAFVGVPLDRTPVSFTMDTIQNWVPGGVRLRLEFDAVFGPGATGSGNTWEVAVDEVVVTVL